MKSASARIQAGIAVSFLTTSRAFAQDGGGFPPPPGQPNNPPPAWAIVLLLFLLLLVIGAFVGLYYLIRWRIRFDREHWEKVAREEAARRPPLLPDARPGERRDKPARAEEVPVSDARGRWEYVRRRTAFVSMGYGLVRLVLFAAFAVMPETAELISRNPLAVGWVCLVWISFIAAGTVLLLSRAVVPPLATMLGMGVLAALPIMVVGQDRGISFGMVVIAMCLELVPGHSAILALQEYNRYNAARRVAAAPPGAAAPPVVCACPECGKAFRVAAAAVGRNVRCPSCRVRVKARAAPPEPRP